MSDPARARSGVSTDATAPAGPEAPQIDPETLADRITEDVIQQLYASRQDLAEVKELGIGEVDAVADQLLDIIGHLRDIAVDLRGHEAGATRVPTVGLSVVPERIADEG